MLNHITIMGRLCADPTLRRTTKGTAVASVAIACDRDYKDANGDKQADFVDLVVWGTNAEFFVQNFYKGRMVVADGRLQIREWQDKDGNRRKTAEVVAERLYFADSKREAPEEKPKFDVPGYDNPGSSNDWEELDDDGDLPF